MIKRNVNHPHNVELNWWTPIFFVTRSNKAISRFFARSLLLACTTPKSSRINLISVENHQEKKTEARLATKVKEELLTKGDTRYEKSWRKKVPDVLRLSEVVSDIFLPHPLWIQWSSESFLSIWNIWLILQDEFWKVLILWELRIWYKILKPPF